MNRSKQPPDVNPKVDEVFKLYNRLRLPHRASRGAKAASRKTLRRLNRRLSRLSLAELSAAKTNTRWAVLAVSQGALDVGNQWLRAPDYGRGPGDNRFKMEFLQRWSQLDQLLLRLEVIDSCIKRAKRAARKPKEKQLPILVSGEDIHTALSDDGATSDEQNKDALLRVAQRLLLKLRAENAQLRNRARLGRMPTKEALVSYLEKCRFSNGRVNTAALGRMFGVSHHTAASWLKKRGVSLD